MFPIPFNFPFRKKDGSLITMQEALDGAGADLDLIDLDDVDIQNPVNDDGLVYDSTSQKWKNKQIVQKNQISNRNLFDNGWFTINQRGQTTYTTDGIYTFDRWKKWAGTISISGIVKTLTVDSEIGYGIITQALDDYSYLEGKKLTMSVMLSDDTVLSGTATFVNASTSVRFFSNSSVLIDFDSGSFRFIVYTDTAFKAIKLEIGTVSTLGMDTAPNYELELLKCERYYIRIGTGSTAALGMGQAIANNDVSIHVPLTVPMRTTPTINLIGTAFLRNGSTYISSLSSSHIVSDTFDTDEITFRFVPPLADAVPGAVYECFLDANSYFEIGADL